MPIFAVPSKQLGKRVDAILAAYDASLSRSSWQKVIKQGLVKVNGRTITDPSSTLSQGRIAYELPKVPLAPPDAVPIIYQDTDVVVFNKPSGVLTHAKGQLSSEWTLADVARPLIEDDGTNRPGIVHRLDRDTSGVIIVARNLNAKYFLQQQFVKRRVFKQYLALVQGRLQQEHYSLSWPLARDPHRPATFKVDLSGKPAQTEVSVIIRLKDASLVSLVPRTGRTHQLRVHLSYLGCPILGDKLYYHSDSTSRLMLHAHQLKLNLPSKPGMNFTAEPTVDWQAELKRHE